jgi:tetratricopeptide (TPR) repeat protein
LVDFDVAIAKLPDPREAWEARGQLYQSAGLWKKSIDDLTRVLEKAPEQASARHARGYAHAALGEWKRAGDDLSRAADDPDATPAMQAQYALLRLHVDHLEAYRQLCRSMTFQHCGNPGGSIKFVVQTAPYGMTEVSNYRTELHPQSAALMAWTCSLAPGVDVTGIPTAGRMLRGVGVSGPRKGPPNPGQAPAQGDFIGNNELVYSQGPPGPFGLVLDLAYRAVSADPRDYVYARALGAALYRAGQNEAALRQLNAAAALRPIPSPSVWLFLALTHHRLGHTDEARRQLEQATRWIQEARQRKPDEKGQMLTWVGLPWTERVALEALHREAQKEILGREDPAALDAVLAYYRDWISDEPKNPMGYDGLGVTLLRQGEFDKAIAAFRQALGVDGRYLPAQVDLGSALMMKGEPLEAVKFLREAVKAVQPTGDSALWYALGKAHADLGQDRKATASFREAITRPPQLPPGGPISPADWHRSAARQNKLQGEAHCELAFALQRQGQMEEGLKSLREGHQLGSPTPGWPYPSGEWLKRAEYLATLEKKLPAILKGELKPGSPEEALEMSALCRARGHPVTAARLADDALKSKPPLGDDMGNRRRFLAACAAAQAASGIGEESAKLKDEEQERWRGQALTWLNADLAVWSHRLETASAKERGEIASILQRWQHDPSLASVRDEAALEKMPNEVREAWRKLWQEVEALRRKALRS